MKGRPYSSRMEAPPPVPVTQPSVQNLAQREGMRFAGCSGSSDWTSRSSLVLMAGDYAGWNWLGGNWVVGHAVGVLKRAGLGCREELCAYQCQVN